MKIIRIPECRLCDFVLMKHTFYTRDAYYKNFPWCKKSKRRIDDIDGRIIPSWCELEDARE